MEVHSKGPNIEDVSVKWVVVKIMVPAWVLSIVRAPLHFHLDLEECRPHNGTGSYFGLLYWPLGSGSFGLQVYGFSCRDLKNYPGDTNGTMI